MPYMRACLKETLRLNAVVAGNARQAGRNIVLDGYRIPKGVRLRKSLLYIFIRFGINLFLPLPFVIIFH